MMPFMSITKNAKKQGIQTYARARMLPEPFRDHELEYLSMRDWYVQTVGRIAQYEEALSQAKAAGDRAHVHELGGKLHGLHAQLVEAKQTVQALAARSFAEAFTYAAQKMLTADAKMALTREAEAIIGRAEHEIKKA